MKIFSIIVSIMFLAGCSPEIEVYFTPSLDCESRIIEQIDNSNESIDIAVYSINNNTIIEAVKRAHSRGIPIRILTDKVQASGRSSRVFELYEDGLDIKIHTKFKIEHNKFAIYDGKVISTGSFNWTNPASTKNSENCIFITNHKPTVSAYAERFNKLWELNSKEKSNIWINKKINERKK